MDRKYTKAEAITFVDEVENAGYEVEHYYGYAMREGPAVRAIGESDLVEIIRATSGRIGWDTLGMGWIVYPKVNDPGEGRRTHQDED